MKKIQLLLLISFNVSALFATFEERWHEMQNVYKKLSSINVDQMDAFVHPYWHSQKASMRSIIMGNPDGNFLFRNPISGTMVRTGFGGRQVYEVDFLLNKISNETKNRVNVCHDSSFGNLPFECNVFNCSTNTLGQLYYFAKILETNCCRGAETCVEFGGGYGCLGRAFKQAFKEMTYIIIDLPEFLALQYLFLTSTLPDTKVIVHSEVPDHIESGVVHLMPVYFLPQLKMNANFFISTFGISEAPSLVQTMVADKKFFNASLCYLSGQLRNPSHPFVNHETLFSCLGTTFKTVEQSPFYYPDLSFLYEVCAKN